MITYRHTYASGVIDIVLSDHARARAHLRLDESPPLRWWARVAEGIVHRVYAEGPERESGGRGYVVPCVDHSGTEVDLVIAADRLHTGDGDYQITFITVYPVAVDGEPFYEYRA